MRAKKFFLINMCLIDEKSVSLDLLSPSYIFWTLNIQHDKQKSINTEHRTHNMSIITIISIGIQDVICKLKHMFK